MLNVLPNLNICWHKVETITKLSLQIRGTEKTTSRELHIAYRYGEHYDSVRRINDNTETPANLQTEMLSKEELNRKGKRTLDDWSELEVDAVQKVRNATGCVDVRLIMQSLEAESYNIESAIHSILQIEELKNIGECDAKPCILGRDVFVFVCVSMCGVFF
ncbi:OTU domain-containing protein 3-like [Bombina bombina]|uniref:OTU domain-containing protein 3-like n=1 Tax=Bombina bombina TaxID=8345 RepID=UPI00235B299A|nr:OTU domain-containing protein 3-like [Bombina bombina]